MIFFDEEWKGRRYRFFAQRGEDGLWIHFAGKTNFWQASHPKKSSPSATAFKNRTEIISPLPGRIQRLFVKKGDRVATGQSLLALSAMKMEYSLRAEGPGHVETLYCTVGQIVGEGQKLIKIKYGPVEHKA